MTKFFKKTAAQGDIYICRIESLPEGVVRSASEDGVVVIAHSETGHHHVMDADKVEMYQFPSLLDDVIASTNATLNKSMPATSLVDRFIVVKEETSLRHLRDYDTHEDIYHAPGIYQIRRQREHVMTLPIGVTRLVVD